MGDQMFACSALRNGASLGERGRTYAYEFDDRTSPLFASLPQNADFDLGATHAAELSYLFKPYGEKIRMNSQQRALSRQMTDYWGDFIRTGHVDDLPDQSRKPGKVLQLRTKAAGGNTVNRDLRAEHRCDFWDSRA
jgi:para-nitrobenzyl esterase